MAAVLWKIKWYRNVHFILMFSSVIHANRFFKFSWHNYYHLQRAKVASVVGSVYVIGYQDFGHKIPADNRNPLRAVCCSILQCIFFASSTLHYQTIINYLEQQTPRLTKLTRVLAMQSESPNRWISSQFRVSYRKQNSNQYWRAAELKYSTQVNMEFNKH